MMYFEGLYLDCRPHFLMDIKDGKNSSKDFESLIPMMGTWDSFFGVCHETTLIKDVNN